MFRFLWKTIKWGVISFVLLIVAIMVWPKDAEKIAQCHAIHGEEQCDMFGNKLSNEMIARNQEQARLAEEDREAEFERQRQEEAARIAEVTENRRKGFHCLNTWDGSHRGVVNWLKDNLRDPDSYEHIETRITPVNATGEHTLIMQYRARNGFGGTNVETLTATVQNSDCNATIVSN
jgi:hypothetical protein